MTIGGSTFTDPGATATDVGDDDVEITTTARDADTVGSIRLLILLLMTQGIHLQLLEL